MLQYSPFSSFTDVSWFEFQIQTTDTSVRISDIYAVFQPGPGSILSVNGSGAVSAPPPSLLFTATNPGIFYTMRASPSLPSPAQGHVDPKYAAILHHVTAVLIIVTGGGGTGKGVWVWGGRGQCSDSVPAIRRRSPVWCLLCNSAVSIIIPGDGRWASPSSERTDPVYMSQLATTEKSVQQTSAKKIR